MRKVVDLVEKIEPGQVALYIDKGGLMHATDEKEHAMTYSVGKIMITDECEEKGGMPIINGERVEVWGAGEGYVYLSKYKRTEKIAYNVSEKTLHIDDTMSLDPIKLPRAEHAAYRIANEYYLMLL